MPEALVLLLVVAALVAAARLCLRGERRPSIPLDRSREE